MSVHEYEGMVVTTTDGDSGVTITEVKANKVFDLLFWRDRQMRYSLEFKLPNGQHVQFGLTGEIPAILPTIDCWMQGMSNKIVKTADKTIVVNGV